MESESQRPPLQEDRPATIEDEGEHHPHRSVLTKVKDKAVKIKDTIKKHGHSHEHEGGRRREDIHQEGYAEEEDEDNEAEDMVQDPELHGAPIYDSAVIRTTNLPAMETDIAAGNPEHAPGPVWPPPVEEAPMVKIGHGVELEADPNTPHDSAAQIPPEVADLTGDGGKEGNIVAPLVSQFDNMSVVDKKPEPEQTHVQSAPEDVPAETHIPENPVSNPKPEHTPAQTTIAGKISSATSAAAVSAKNAVASKLGYGGGGPEQSASEEGKVEGQGGTVKEYMAEKLKPGDEEKALSEKITEVFTRKKEGAVVEGSRVKESEEVTAHLGPVTEKKREGEDALAAGAESSGQGVVDRLKDAVGAWLGKGTALQTAQDSAEGTYLSDPLSATDQVKKGEEASGEKKA